MSVILTDDKILRHPSDRIPLSAAYLAGRRAQAWGLRMSANPYPRLSGEWQLYLLGWLDAHHGVSVERRAADAA